MSSAVEGDGKVVLLRALWHPSHTAVQLTLNFISANFLSFRFLWWRPSYYELIELHTILQSLLSLTHSKQKIQNQIQVVSEDSTATTQKYFLWIEMYTGMNSSVVVQIMLQARDIFFKNCTANLKEFEDYLLSTTDIFAN